MILELKENARLDADTDAEALKLIRRKKRRFDAASPLDAALHAMLASKPEGRATAAAALATLEAAGLWKKSGRDPPPPLFPTHVLAEGGAEIEAVALCRKLEAVVPETFLAAQSYGRFAPDMDARLLAVVAAKVHEHRPKSDERMTAALGLSVEALEEAQEELLRRTDGCLLVQSFKTVKL